MLTNFVYAKSKAMFEERLNSAQVPNDAIVFIEDTREIWTHGTYFDGSPLDPDTIPTIQVKIDELQIEKQNKWNSVALTGSTVTIDSASENTFYYNNTAITQLTISSFINSGEPRGLYKVAVKTGSSGMSLSLPTDVYWANGVIPEILPNTIYELSIEFSLGVYKAILLPFNQI